MYWSKLFIPTLREDPAGVEDLGLRLLVRAGYVRHMPGGGIALLPLARRSLRKIVQIAREEMDAMGAQEVYVPAGQSMLPLAQELRSYKQLPQIWYQFQTGLESVSFDATEPARRESCHAIEGAFRRILDRCGLQYERAGSRFVAPSEAGQESIVRSLNYIAHIDEAEGFPCPPTAPDPEGEFTPEAFQTPGVKTIVEIAAFTGLPETSQIKSLVMMADQGPVMVLLRGDHHLSEPKLQSLLGTGDLRPATPEEIRQHFSADAGSLGPVGVGGVAILADEALRGRRNMISGANRNGYHLRHVTPGRDFEARFADLRQVAPGDTRGGDPLTFEKAVELARVSALPGKRYDWYASGSWLALAPLLFTAARQNHDQDGLMLPVSIAPFQAVITTVFAADPAQRRAAEEILQAARAAGLDVVMDDRDERAGVKFKDADLTGIPLRINIGKKLTQGFVEMVERRSGRTESLSLAVVMDKLKLVLLSTPPQPGTGPEPEP